MGVTVIKGSFQKHFKVKAKVVGRGEGVLKVSPPLPPPKILIVHQYNEKMKVRYLRNLLFDLFETLQHVRT